MKASQVIHEDRQRIKEASALLRPFICCLACLERIFSKKGQQVMEYAIVISMLSLSLSVIFLYAKRGLQNVIKVSADQIGPQADSILKSSVNVEEDSVSRDVAATLGAVRIDKTRGGEASISESFSASAGVTVIQSTERVL